MYSTIRIGIQRNEVYCGIVLYKQSRPRRSALPDFQLFLHSPRRRPAVRACPAHPPHEGFTLMCSDTNCFYPVTTPSMSLNRKVEYQVSISCAVGSLRVPAAVAVNDSLPENTSGASDEGGTLASSMFMMASRARHWRGTTLIVFSASWQSGRGIRAGLIFCSFCIKTKGKDNIFFPYFSLMKSTKNPARTTLSPHSAKTAEIGAKSV